MLTKFFADALSLCVRKDFFSGFFADVCVASSIDLELIPQSLDIVGDGTCINTKASPYGKRICSCKKKHIYNCSCARRFSAPNAAWGWDSSQEKYFYGYTGYFLSTYNNDLKLSIGLAKLCPFISNHYVISSIKKSQKEKAPGKYQICRKPLFKHFPTHIARLNCVFPLFSRCESLFWCGKFEFLHFPLKWIIDCKKYSTYYKNDCANIKRNIERITSRNTANQRLERAAQKHTEIKTCHNHR